MNPLVSVVVTTKNEEKNIEDCLKSILAQTYKNIEIIVVDNTVMADVEFLNVPEAKIFETALYSGKLHLRTAGIGSIHKQDNGTYTVGEDYQLTSCFLTDDPA